MTIITFLLITVLPYSSVCFAKDIKKPSGIKSDNNKNTSQSHESYVLGVKFIDAIRAYSGDIEQFKRIQQLLKVVNPNTLEENVDTALIVACRKGDLEIVKLLLADERTDPNLQNKAGNTALIWACRKGDPEIIKALLEDKRTDPTLMNKAGETALDIVKTPELKQLVKKHIKQWEERQK